MASLANDLRQYMWQIDNVEPTQSPYLHTIEGNGGFGVYKWEAPDETKMQQSINQARVLGKRGMPVGVWTKGQVNVTWYRSG